MADQLPEGFIPDGFVADEAPRGLTGLTRATGIGPEPTALERIVNAVGPSIRGAGDVTGANWILEHTGLVPKGRLSGPEQNARDEATRHATGVGGMAAGAMELGSGLYNSAVNPEGILNRLRVNPGAILDVKLNQPLKTLKDVVKIAPKPNPALPLAQDLGPGARVLQGADQFREPYSVPTVSERGAAVANPSAPATSLTDAERAALIKQGYTPQTLAKIEGQLRPADVAALTAPSGAAPNVPHASQMLSAEGPFAEPPTAHGPTAADREMATLARINGQHPLTEPRTAVGAEAVGRQAGMTKQAVREATGPILGEAQGEASPIVPEETLKKFVDKMKALPREGNARVDYVNAAKDLKTRAQLENLRRTFGQLGLVGAGAVGSRQMLVNGLNGDTQ